MQIQRNSIRFIRLLADLFILSICYIGVYSFVIGHISLSFNLTHQSFFTAVLIIWFFVSNSYGVYDEFRSRNFAIELIILIKTFISLILITIVLLFFIKDLSISRNFIIIFSIITPLVLIAEKVIFRSFLKYYRKKGRNVRSIIIVGAGEVGKNFCDSISLNPHFGYKIIGFLDDKSKTFLNGQYLGKINELENILTTKRVDDVIIALPTYATDRLSEVVHICERHTTRIKIIPDYFRF